VRVLALLLTGPGAALEDLLHPVEGGLGYQRLVASGIGDAAKLDITQVVRVTVLLLTYESQAITTSGGRLRAFDRTVSQAGR